MTYIRKILIQMFLDFIIIFLSTDKALIIGLQKKLTFGSLAFHLHVLKIRVVS